MKTPDSAVILEDRFGLLRYDQKIVFDDVSVAPLPEHAELLARLDKIEHVDGFLYPPSVRQVSVDPVTGQTGGELPKTKRPAFLWKVPPSHLLTVPTNLDRDTFRKATGGFLIHLIAYFFGTRLQFHDWWVDSRMPTKPQADIWRPEKIVEPFLTAAYRTWLSWPSEDQIAMTGLLSTHSRVPGYGWVWERFTFEYIVLDGLYALGAPRLGLPKRGWHSQRIDRLCTAYGIPTDSDTVERLVNVRNDLFHQNVFGDENMGSSGHGSVFALTFRLRDLNRRIIAATLGWDSPFVHSPWWQLDSVPFDL